MQTGSNGERLLGSRVLERLTSFGFDETESGNVRPMRTPLTAELLPLIAAQAAEADRTRSISPDVITALKRSSVMVMSASKELGGLGSTMTEIADELGAVAGACTSTAWCLWNHLSVFHLYVGALGPSNIEVLRGIVDRHEWVSFPAGAGSRIYGRIDGAEGSVELNGPSTFGSGARYGDWVGAAFAVVDEHGVPVNPPDLRFTIVPIDGRLASVEPTWDGVALRASATDTVHHCGSRVPLSRCATWYSANRAEVYRHLDYPVVHPRYREDWVGLSDMWLAAQAVGVAEAAIGETVDGVRSRRAIIGTAMVDLPMVPMRIGEATAMVAVARAAVQVGCAEIDQRIAESIPPSEGDYQRQLALSAQALRLCREAMDQLLTVLGGNGLREGASFQRRYRDLLAMPLHINAHPDRVYDKVGRHLLGVAPVTKF